MTIGPHEGKELELMLAGTKKLSAFGDIVPDNGHIAEEIIPEKAFTPYVSKGQIKRFEQTVTIHKTGKKVRHVCFTLPGEEWRAHTYLWLRGMIHEGALLYEDNLDILFGQLLGYEEKDIQDFITTSRHFFSSQDGHKSPLDPP